MDKKVTLRRQVLRTSLLMLVLSLVLGLVAIGVMMALFAAKVPNGEQFLVDSFAFLFGKQTYGPRRIVPYMIVVGMVLCLLVAAVCILLTSTCGTGSWTFRSSPVTCGRWTRWLSLWRVSAGG